MSVSPWRLRISTTCIYANIGSTELQIGKSHLPHKIINFRNGRNNNSKCSLLNGNGKKNCCDLNMRSGQSY